MYLRPSLVELLRLSPLLPVLLLHHLGRQLPLVPRATQLLQQPPPEGVGLQGGGVVEGRRVGQVG